MIVQGLWVGSKISKIEYMSYSSFIDKESEFEKNSFMDILEKNMEGSFKWKKYFPILRRR